MLLPDLARLSIASNANGEQQSFSNDEMSDSDEETEEERLGREQAERQNQVTRDMIKLVTSLGLKTPAAKSVQRQATLVAKMLTYPHSAEQVSGDWSSPPTNAFPQAAHFIGAVRYLRKRAVYPADYAEIGNLKTFEHWNATRLIPDHLLGMELDSAMQALEEEGSRYEGKGYYVRRDLSASRIFVFGDSHGSLHSMADMLINMHNVEDAFNPWVDDDGLLKLQHNVTVVFLGDVLDRSPYALECLYLVLRLMRENPRQVYFLAGNHEAYKWLWTRDSGSIYEMQGEYNNRVYVPEFPFLNGRRPMDEVIYDVTRLLPASLIARTPVGMVQFNHGSFEPWLDPDYASAEQLSAFKSFAMFSTMESTHPTLQPFRLNRLQWGDLVTDHKDAESERKGRAQSTASDLRDYLMFMDVRLLIRGHSDMANLSLVYPPGKQPSDELQLENAVGRLPRGQEVWNYYGKVMVDKRKEDKAYPGGFFVRNLVGAHGNFSLYDMWTLQPSAAMSDFNKTLIKDGVEDDHPIGITVSSCPFSRPAVPAEMMSVYLRIDGEF